MIYNIINDKAIGNYLVEVDDVYKYLNKDNLTDLTASSTSFIYNCVGRASQLCENRCNTSLSASSFTGIYKGCSFDGDIYTNNIPINSISNLYYKLSPNVDWSEIDVNSNNIDILGNTSLKLINNIYQDAYYKICYNAGFTTVPDDIKQVVIEMIVEMYQESYVGKKPRLGEKSINEENKTISFYELSDRHKKILNNYTRFII